MNSESFIITAKDTWTTVQRRRTNVPQVPAVFHRGSFLIFLLVLGYYDQSRLNDWLFVPLWGRLSFLSTN